MQTDNGGGSNHFALRGVTSGNSAAPVTIAGNTYMGIYANVGSNQLTKFYLARVPTAAAGHTLVLNFYDIGDADSTRAAQVAAADRQQHRRDVRQLHVDRQQRLGASASLPNTHDRAVGPGRPRSTTARSPASTTSRPSGTRSGAR